jgi:beta-N-acetylhexosaminidase
MKYFKTSSLLLLGIIALLVCVNCNTNKEEITKVNLPEAISYNFKPTDTTWKSLSLREKIGQTMIIRAYYEEQILEFGSIENMMENYPVGGIFIPDWKFLYVKPRENVIANIQKTVLEYENAAPFPLIITEDFERGVGSTYYEYTHMPALISLGAANSKALAQKFGSAIAKEANTLGINWLLHPVVDLNINPLQNLVVERAISDDSNRAYPLLHAQINGMKKQGVVATIKHFPGDGATMKNQHFITSANNLSINEWKASFGTLYQKLINDGVACIMIGHIRFPAYQKEKIKGVFPPASLSSELMTDLLKGEMKFNGVIMSDALNMGGVGGYYKNQLETSIESFKAGVDLVLWPELSYLDSVEVRINRGEISMDRLNDAVERIWGIREKYGLLHKKEKMLYEISEEEINEIKKTATQVANNAVTLLSDTYNEIPLQPSTTKKIAIVNLSHIDRTKEFLYTQKLLNEKGFEVNTILHNPIFFEWQDKLAYFDQFDKIIVAFENRYFNPLGSSMLKDKEALGLWTMGMLPQEKIIAISYSNPYYVDFYFDNAAIRINAYSIDNYSQKAVVDALTGTIKFKGTSPVKLNHETMR